MTIHDIKNDGIAQDIVKELIDLKKMLTPANVLDFVLLAMSRADQIKELTGADKKKVVYLTLLKLINTVDDQYIKERRFCQIVLDNVYHSFVENTVYISKNPTEFLNKIVKNKGLLLKMKEIVLKLFKCKKA
jgi:hypothetical protein